MKSCPNATCSFALKFKRAGEYQDTATSCSDCGGPLVEGPTAPPASLKAAAVMVVPSDANQRLAVTVGGALAFAVLSQLPVMGTAGVSMEEVPSSSLLGLFNLDGCAASFGGAFSGFGHGGLGVGGCCALPSRAGGDVDPRGPLVSVVGLVLWSIVLLSYFG